MISKILKGIFSCRYLYNFMADNKISAGLKIATYAYNDPSKKKHQEVKVNFKFWIFLKYTLIPT